MKYLIAQLENHNMRFLRKDSLGNFYFDLVQNAIQFESRKEAEKTLKQIRIRTPSSPAFIATIGK